MNNWTAIAVIIVGYAVGLYFQNKRIDDFKEGLYHYLDAKFGALEARVEKLEKQIDSKRGAAV